MQISRRNFFRTTLSASAIGAAAMVANGLSFPAEAFGEPQRSRSLDPHSAPGAGPVFLNSNENAYGPWPSMMDTMREALTQGHRYPDAACDTLSAKIAELNRVKQDRVTLGCGSSEILRVCAELFCGPNKTLVQASPTFESLGHYAQVRGAKVRSVPLNADFEHDLDNMLPVAGETIGLVYICNPNNPTASLTPRKKIEAYIQRLPQNTYVLIDEAYHHFALRSPDYVSFLDQPVNDPRIIVARTFSKIYGLAGMRLGYGIATPETTKKMKQYSSFDNVNVVSAKVGVEALNDASGLAAAIKRLENDRASFLAEAKKRQIACLPTQANFAMIDTGKPIRQVIEYFRAKNVLIGRPFPPMNTHARITFGTPAEMQVFWKTWDEMKA